MKRQFGIAFLFAIVLAVTIFTPTRQAVGLNHRVTLNAGGPVLAQTQDDQWVPTNPANSAPANRIYVDPLYGYQLSLPQSWRALATPADAIYGAAVFLNYDPDLAEFTETLPNNHLKMQIGVAPLLPNQDFQSWADKWRSHQISNAREFGLTWQSTAIQSIIINEFRGLSYEVRGLEGELTLELLIPTDYGQIFVIGITPSTSLALDEVQGILSSLRTDVTSTFSTEVNTLAQQWYEGTPILSESVSSSLPLAIAGSCPAGTFPGGEAPNSPITLRMPFRDGETWTVGGAGSFYGNGAHCNSNDDYYATDWNRSGDDGAAVLPVADGTISGSQSPTCPTTGYGCYVLIDHASSTRTRYAHLSGVHRTSGSVSYNDQIGAVGTTGNSSGPHLHLSFLKLDGAYHSHCYNNGSTCPNGEGPISPQSPKPSPMITASGSQSIVDGQSYTSSRNQGGSCPQSGGVILYWNGNYNCNNDQGDAGYRQRTGTGWQNVNDGSFNDKASSVKVPSGWSVKLFANADRGEPSVCFSGDISDFGTQGNFPGSGTAINDNVSSMEVFSSSGCGGAPGIPSLSSPANGAVFNRNTGITLSWNTASNASSYYAEMWGGPNASYNSGWTSGTSWAVGQPWGGAYQWRVKARNSSGTESGWSETRSFTVKYGSPSGLTATAASGSQINLSWNASADAPGNIDGYRIYRGGTAIATVGGSTTSYQNTGLSCGEDYSYMVKAYKGGVESDASNTAGATPSPCAPPTPTNFRVTGTTAGSVSLAWDDVLGETGYKVYKWGIENDVWDFYYHATVGNNITTYTETGLNCLSEYFYEVSAFNSVGESVHHSWVKGTTTECLGPGNDDFDSPIAITSLPYINNQDTAAATTAIDDPVFTCVASQNSASVWYRYTATTNGILTANTEGSGYDTVLAVWSGARGSLTSVTCDDDSGPGVTSSLTTNLTSGSTYYIEVAQYGSAALAPSIKPDADEGTDAGGSLVLNVDFVPSRPDLVIETLAYSPSNPVVGQGINLRVGVRNQGAAPLAYDVWLDFYIDHQPAGCDDGEYSLWWYLEAPLAPGEYREFTTTHSLPAGQHSMWAYVDSQCSATESNDSNNIEGPVWINVGEPNTTADLYISPSGTGNLAGKAFTGADILSYTKASNTWDVLYDGSYIGTPKNVGAFAFDGDNILLGFSANQTIAGLDTFAAHDLALFTPTLLGYNNTAGSFAWYFDGSDVGLTLAAETIDALWIDANGQLYISTTGSGVVPVNSALPSGTKIKFQDEDILRFTPSSTGATTAGTWSLYWNPTSITGMSAEDINGYWEDPATGHRYVTILGAFNVGNAAYGGKFAGNGKTILRFVPNTAAPGGWAPAEIVPWLAAGATFPSTIDGIEMTR